MLISYDPLNDVLSITLQAAPTAQTQTQGTTQVGFDANGAPVSVSIPNASTTLWENGGQVNVMLPEAAPSTVVETIVERRVI